MQNKYSKKQIEELYNCDIFKDSDLNLWVAQAVQFTDDGEDCFFVQASGHDVDELHENIRKKIRNHAYMKGYNTAIDDFVDKISTYGTYDHHGNTIDVLEIAEQMKKGDRT